MASEETKVCDLSQCVDDSTKDLYCSREGGRFLSQYLLFFGGAIKALFVGVSHLMDLSLFLSLSPLYAPLKRTLVLNQNWLDLSTEEFGSFGTLKRFLQVERPCGFKRMEIQNSQQCL